MLFDDGQVGFVGFAALTEEVVDDPTDETDEEGTIVLSVVAIDDDDVIALSLDELLTEELLVALETDNVEENECLGRARILAAAASAAT